MIFYLREFFLVRICEMGNSSTKLASQFSCSTTVNGPDDGSRSKDAASNDVSWNKWQRG